MSERIKSHLDRAVQDKIAACAERVRKRLGQSIEEIATLPAQEWQEMSEGTRQTLLEAIEERGRQEGARASHTLKDLPPAPARSKLRQHLARGLVMLGLLPPLRVAAAAGLLIGALALGAEITHGIFSQGGLAGSIDHQQAASGQCKRLSPAARGCRYRVQQSLTLTDAMAAAQLPSDTLQKANPTLIWPAHAGAILQLPFDKETNP